MASTREKLKNRFKKKSNPDLELPEPTAAPIPDDLPSLPNVTPQLIDQVKQFGFDKNIAVMDELADGTPTGAGIVSMGSGDDKMLFRVDTVDQGTDFINKVRSATGEPPVGEGQSISSDALVVNAIHNGDLEAAQDFLTQIATPAVREDLTADALLADKFRAFQERRAGQTPSNFFTKSGEFKGERLTPAELERQGRKDILEKTRTRESIAREKERSNRAERNLRLSASRQEAVLAKMGVDVATAKLNQSLLAKKLGSLGKFTPQIEKLTDYLSTLKSALDSGLLKGKKKRDTEKKFRNALTILTNLQSAQVFEKK